MPTPRLMALVDYNSEYEEEEDQNVILQDQKHRKLGVPVKRKRSQESGLPPLPSKLHDLYASTTRLSAGDDPSLHGGRKRTTPHIDGNWPSHVYIEWHPSTTERDLLSQLIETVRIQLTKITSPVPITSLLLSDLGAPLPLHISLSRAIQLTTLQKEHLVNSLQRLVAASGIQPFIVNFTDLEWVANFEKTRWFLVLRVAPPKRNQLNQLLHLCNLTAQKFRLPCLYTPPIILSKHSPCLNSRVRNPRDENCVDLSEVQDASTAFHISIAWTLEPPSQGLREMTKDLTVSLLKDITQIDLQISCIKVKVGNIVTCIPLSQGIIETKGVF